MMPSSDQPIRFTVGDVLVQAATDLGSFEFPLASVLPDATPEALAPHLPWLEPLHVDSARGVVKFAARSMLLCIDDRNVLIDTCVGCKKSRPRRADWDQRTDQGFISELHRCGVSPEQIDVVFCTHLHVDHVGWNTRLENGRWVPTFPNARYLAGRREMTHWQAMAAHDQSVGHGSFLDSVVPVIEAGQFDLVDDGYELGTGAELRGLPGHTPGQMGLFLHRGQDRAVFCGDAIHSPVQVVEPGWTALFDTDRPQAAQTRTTMLQEVAEQGALLVPAHFRGSGRVRVVPRGERLFPQFAAS